MQLGAPAGCGDSIPTAGVFPAADGDSAAVEKSRQFGAQAAQLLFDAEAHANYKSFEEAGQYAEEEVKRILDRSFADQFATWAQVTARWAKAVACKARKCGSALVPARTKRCQRAMLCRIP